MKKIIIYFLLFFIFTIKIKSHSVQIAYCVDCSGNLRIFVEHWHGAQDPNGITMTIQLNVNSVITTQTNTPAFGIMNVPFGSLPGCATPITSVAGCPGNQNTYDDWLIYDYTGLPAGVPISFTILSGNNSFTSDGCGMYPLTINFTTPPSTVVNGSSITVCQGQSIAAITVPSGLNWSNSNPSIGLAASGVGPIASFIATNFGNASISYFTSCFESTLVAVTVNPLPVVTIINSSPVCIGSSLTLNSSATNSYTWVGASGFTSNLQNPSIINTAILNAGIYSLTVSNTNGCTSTATTNVVINALPVVSISANASVCVGSIVNFTASGGQTYFWNGPNSFTSGIQNPSIINTAILNAGIYSLTVSNTNGCTNTATTNVVINALPVVSISANSTLCVGSPLNLIGNVALSYFWSGPNSFTSGIQNPSIINTAILNAGIYSLTVSNTNGCTNTATTNVVINALPVVSISANASVCVGSIINFTASGGQTYFWNGPNSFTSGIQNPSIINTAILNAGNYNLTVTNINGCTSTATTNVVVNVSPIVSITANSTLCVGSSLNLIGNVALSYFWSGPNSFTSSIQNPIIINTAILNAGIYSLTVSNAIGCTNTATTNVIINTLPVVLITANASVCIGSSINLTSNGALSYFWSGPNSFTGSIQNETIINTSVLNQGNYVLSIIDANYCKNSDSLYISVLNCTGLKTINTLNGISIFPNPVVNTIYLIGKLEDENKYYINIINEEGKIIKKQKYTSTIDVCTLKNGIYLLIIENGSKIIFSEKFIKTQ